MTEGAPEKPTSAPRTREASARSLLFYEQEGPNDQLKEDVRVNGEESDLPIVVGDGRTDHMAKGQAEGHRHHSTHASGRNAPKQSVSRTLEALTRKAQRDKKHRFRSLYRLIDLQDALRRALVV